jgi:uncharacterized protein YbbC (DUF1343 family)
MKFFKIFFLALLLLSPVSCQQSNDSSEVLFGADLLVSEYLDLVKNKNIGLVINQTSVMKNGTPLLDTLRNLKINIKAVFSPEHGFKGTGTAGELINDSADSLTGLKIYSLYGKDKKPTKEMLQEINLLIFDLQDIGARFYTYISTLYLTIEAAAENNIPVLVLDRPNPLGGLNVEGPILEEGNKSFIGITRIPIVHGMTVGELNNFFANEINISGNTAEVSVIKMKNWERNYFWSDLNRNWIPTSPNIPDFETALIYPGTCLLEGTNISEGRGTETPFKIIGAPFINSEELIAEMNSRGNEGVELTAVSFIPLDIQGKAMNPKFENENCNGIFIKVIDKENFHPVEFGIKLIYAFQKLYPDKFEFIPKHFDNLIGNELVRKRIIEGAQPDSVFKSLQEGLNKFKEDRKQYLLY